MELALLGLRAGSIQVPINKLVCVRGHPPKNHFIHRIKLPASNPVLFAEAQAELVDE
jgi:hypothetical protein